MDRVMEAFAAGTLEGICGVFFSFYLEESCREFAEM
jgi:hypothetical protein